MISIVRLLEFDAAHRVMNHESKCATLHGHRYKVEVEATAPQLDDIGRVIDFSVIKDKLGSWLDQYWDHTSIICIDDKETLELIQKMPQKKPCYISKWNPTAENMAGYLLNRVCPDLFSNTEITVTRIVVWETPNCRAEATL